MTLYAILSDIHGNYQALKAVEADARAEADKEGYDKLHFICLGDVVDYGPQPNECMEWVDAHAEIVIQGNHDKAVAAALYEPPLALARDYWPITLWTRRVLRPEFKKRLGSYPRKKIGAAGLENFTLLHSTLKADDLYIEYTRLAEENHELLETPYGLFGHTHYQGYFIERGLNVVMGLTCPTNENQKKPESQRDWEPVKLNQWFPLPGHWYRALYNPGSVGQPRRHAYLVGAGVPVDNRAAYMLLRIDEEKREQAAGAYQFRRVEYEVGKTIDLLTKLKQEKNWQVEIPAQQKSRHNVKKLADMLENMGTLLPKLIEQALIPKLRDG